MLKLDDPFSLFLLVLSLLLKREDQIYEQKFVARAKKHSCEAQNEIELIAHHNPLHSTNTISSSGQVRAGIAGQDSL